MMKRILFYSPFGNRTGSDMMLSYIIKNLDRNKFYPIVFSEKRWPLMNELREVVPIYSSNMQLSRLNRLLDLTGRRFFGTSLYENQIYQIIKRHQPDIIYLNTIVCQKIIPVLKSVEVPFIVHCHELTYSYQGISAADLDFLIRRSKLLIGCSQEVCSQLRMLGAERVAITYEAIDRKRLPSTFKNNHIRGKWKIPENAKVWVMAGLRHYRKGFDLIPDIARRIKKEEGWIVWLGRSFNTGYDTLVQKSIETNNLDNIVLIDEQDDDYFSLLQMADGLVLTSREDPFPLVMLEAAWLGKPIVAFESGGVSEFLLEGMGRIVKKFDTEELSNVILEYMSGRLKSDPGISSTRAEDFEIGRIMTHWHQVVETSIA
ncbi:MAG TPA: glycosyltransferase [Chitinophagales bacterium]|nr:glycosyltransferase [Chitinophagales bacterium]